MKGLYIADFDFGNKKLIGIQKKVNWMCDGVRENNISIDMFYINDIYMIVKSLDYTDSKIYLNKDDKYKFIIQYINRNNYDFIFIRHIPTDYFFIKFLEEIKRVNGSIKIIIEFPTLPYDKEIKNQRILNIDKYFRKFIKKYADLAVTYNDVKDAYGIHNLYIGNGINIKSIDVVDRCPEKDVFTMIGVANISVWHGYDRVIKGIKEYYTKDNHNKVKFIIVGVGDELPRLIDLTKKLNLQDEVIFAGYKTGDGLLEMYKKANVGIGALARSRINMNDGSSLKNREYCSLGLPFIYSGYDIDFEQFKYSFQVSDDETPIDIRALINFYKELTSNKDYVKDMRQYAEEKLDWKIKMKCILDYIF